MQIFYVPLLHLFNDGYSANFIYKLFMHCFDLS